jgi:hypothetical protein
MEAKICYRFQKKPPSDLCPKPDESNLQALILFV